MSSIVLFLLVLTVYIAVVNRCDIYTTERVKTKHDNDQASYSMFSYTSIQIHIGSEVNYKLIIYWIKKVKNKLCIPLPLKQQIKSPTHSTISDHLFC